MKQLRLLKTVKYIVLCTVNYGENFYLYGTIKIHKMASVFFFLINMVSVSLFNSISTMVSYLMPKPSL